MRHVARRDARFSARQLRGLGLTVRRDLRVARMQLSEVSRRVYAANAISILDKRNSELGAARI